MSRERVRRVMREFGIRPDRRRGRKWRKKRAISARYANHTLGVIPAYLNCVWAADFTELAWRGKTVYVGTVIDLFTREILGVSVGLRKGAALTIQALSAALLHHSHPAVFHSDSGKEDDARAFIAVLHDLGIRFSRSHPGCPWENGYQESFYNKFKVDLGEPSRFASLGEFVAEINRTIWTYNHARIHSPLGMPPKVFAEQYAVAAQNPSKSLLLGV